VNFLEGLAGAAMDGGAWVLGRRWRWIDYGPPQHDGHWELRRWWFGKWQ
jgi:hypothetical protein